MTQGRRIQLELEHAQPMADIRSIQGEINEILSGKPQDADDKFTFDNETNAKLWNLINKRDLIANSKVNPAWVKLGLNKIEGLEDEDGKPVTPETFIDNAPADLYKEVLDAIHHEAGLDAKETGN
jgi:hypothetical protein